MLRVRSSTYKLKSGYFNTSYSIVDDDGNQRAMFYYCSPIGKYVGYLTNDPHELYFVSYNAAIRGLKRAIKGSRS